MPDITMCSNSECPFRNHCYRFRAVPSEYQSYTRFEPDADGRCESYIEIHYGDKLATNTEKRQAYMRASDARVALWSEAKREAF